MMCLLYIIAGLVFARWLYGAEGVGVSEPVSNTDKLDPSEIWLQPSCCASDDYGRLWAENDVGTDWNHCECVNRCSATRYVHEDRILELEAQLAEAREAYQKIKDEQPFMGVLSKAWVLETLKALSDEGVRGE